MPTSKVSPQEAQEGDGDGNVLTPLLPTEATRRSISMTRLSVLLQDWWLWEIVSVVTCLLAIVVVILILAIFDSSSRPDWPSIININSILSLCGTVAKLSILSAVGAAVNQCKWLWYRQRSPRNLQDLQLFDDASRGPWGATQLLLTLRARHLAFLGCSIIILQLLFDPFLQQSVDYPDRLSKLHHQPVVARAQNYEARSFEGLPLPSIVDLSMKAAIYNGAFNIEDQAQFGTAHTCQTSNCTWPPFSSLAVCSECVNITSLVSKKCNESGCYESALPDGPALSGHGSQINSSITSISTSLHKIEPSVVRFSSLISKGSNSTAVVSATECAMWYCVQIYDASVVDGAFSQQITKSWRNDSASLFGSSDLIYEPPDSFTKSTSTSSTFRVARLAATTLNSFMAEMFTGTGGISSNGSAFSSDVIQALYLADNLTSRIHNVAVSMTNNIRQQNDSLSNTANGTAWATETFVHVRWGWFALPAAMVILSLIFLIGSIVETSYREVPVWKASNIAVLFHGQSMDLKDPRDIAVTELSQMGDQARAINVQLEKNGEGRWELVQKTD